MSALICAERIGPARELDVSCVVEGIETDDQLRALPPDVHGQGFLLGRPVRSEALLPLLRRRAPALADH